MNRQTGQKGDARSAEALWSYAPAFQAYNKSKALAPGTIRIYSIALRLFYEWFVAHYGRDTPLKASHVREWVAYRFSLGNKPATLRGYVQALKVFFNFLVADEVITEDENPIRLVKGPRVATPEIRPLTQEEIRRLLDSFDKHTLAGFRDYTMCLLMLDTGLRAGEVVGLDITDIDFERSGILVRGKGQKIRVVYFGQTVKNVLLDYVQRARPWMTNGAPILFPSFGPNTKCLRLKSKYLTNLVRLRFNELGIPYGSAAHRLRHTFAVHFLRNGGGVFQLQRLLGHATLNMTRRYVLLAEDDLQEAHSRASPIDMWNHKESK